MSTIKPQIFVRHQKKMSAAHSRYVEEQITTENEIKNLLKLLFRFKAQSTQEVRVFLGDEDFEVFTCDAFFPCLFE